ncbi:MAG: hypothetical protein J6B68_01790 [Lachnospiraceae bacterium]|nr:hypothetical protein [Lachnospiraceae bacterium]MBP3477579.1 hypothetical protein [Lachnospiraceae bacterium]
MSDRHLCKAKRIDNGEWIKGHIAISYSLAYIIQALSDGNFKWYDVDQSTICKCTGLKERNGKLIWENDITKLVLPDGEVRYFKVSFKKVIRKVLCHPDFDDDVAKVELNAICFEWNGYELFPCIDENGVSDVSKMEVVGNIFDNPELLEDGANA